MLTQRQPRDFETYLSLGINVVHGARRPVARYPIVNLLCTYGRSQGKWEARDAAMTVVGTYYNVYPKTYLTIRIVRVPCIVAPSRILRYPSAAERIRIRDPAIYSRSAR